MRRTWFISDTHFFHTNIIKYCDRPFASCEEMNAVLIANWNARVQPGDLVWHLGDFTFGPFAVVESLCRQLAGEKHLVMGNHDRLTKAQYLRAGFTGAVWEAQVELENFRIGLSHCKQLPKPGEDFCLHGHQHGQGAKTAWAYDISVEVTGYKPIELSELSTVLGFHPEVGKMNEPKNN